MLTQARLKELLHYDPETGEFTRLVATSNVVKVGDIIGKGAKTNWYKRVGIDGRDYYLHRLAFLYMVGDWPRFDVDHISGNRTDNRWCNLRDVPTQTNLQNVRRASSRSKSGVLGVVHLPHRKRWVSSVQIDGRQQFLGSFKTAQEAETAYLEAKRKHHAGFLL